MRKGEGHEEDHLRNPQEHSVALCEFLQEYFVSAVEKDGLPVDLIRRGDIVFIASPSSNDENVLIPHGHVMVVTRVEEDENGKKQSIGQPETATARIRT